MTPRRIAYIVNVFPKLSETFIAGEIAELRRRGLEVIILSLRKPTEELRHDIITEAGLDKITVYDESKFSKILSEFQPDLIHAHFATEPTATARIFAEQLKIPFTFTTHGYDIRRKAPVDFRERAEAAAALVTVSQANASYMTERFGVSAEKITVIPCGIDTETFRPEKNNKGSADSVPLILCVARHAPVKNLVMLLRACAALRERQVKFRCALVGDGPCHAELKSLRAELNLEDWVAMPGATKQNEVVRWWQSASVGALTSENEGMPVCLMEAAACGVPVVATAVGGIPELVQNDVTGLLVPLNDVKKFSDALQQLLEEAPLRNKMGTAARCYAEENFSVKRQVNSLLKLWSNLLKPKGLALVEDPFGVANDPEMPSLAVALDPIRAKKELKRGLQRLSMENGIGRLKEIRVTRYKPGRRCVVEYKVMVEKPDSPPEEVILVGKVRARRYGNEGYRLLDEFWRAGFEAEASDGISVPEPMGVLPEFKMWFQRKITGEVSSNCFSTTGGIELAKRIAEAAVKIHRANIPTDKTHTMTDELRILRDCLKIVAEGKPEWTNRIEKVFQGCERLGLSLPQPKLCGIHRDFYSDQVIVTPEARLFILDFDLYCQGDPALDIGNFIGHLTEQSLRTQNRFDAFSEAEKTLEETFVRLAGECTRPAVDVYTTLTLARHIFLSTKFEDRRPLTETLLQHCEERLAKSGKL